VRACETLSEAGSADRLYTAYTVEAGSHDRRTNWLVRRRFRSGAAAHIKQKQTKMKAGPRLLCLEEL